MGLLPPAIKWCRCYLQSHYQVVKIYSAFSDQLLMTFGMPQGSTCVQSFSVSTSMIFRVLHNTAPPVLCKGF